MFYHEFEFIYLFILLLQLVTLHGSKSGAKRLFAAAEVNLPPGAHDIWDEQEFFFALAQLMLKHLDVQVGFCFLLIATLFSNLLSNFWITILVFPALAVQD